MKVLIMPLAGLGALAAMSTADAAPPAYCALYAREYANQFSSAIGKPDGSEQRIQDEAYYRCLNQDENPAMPMTSAYSGTDVEGDGGVGGPLEEVTGEGDASPPDEAVPVEEAKATAAAEPGPKAEPEPKPKPEPEPEPKTEPEPKVAGPVDEGSTERCFPEHGRCWRLNVAGIATAGVGVGMLGTGIGFIKAPTWAASTGPNEPVFDRSLRPPGVVLVALGTVTVVTGVLMIVAGHATHGKPAAGRKKETARVQVVPGGLRW